MKRLILFSFFVALTSEALFAADAVTKIPLWPEGKIPNLQTNLYYKPFVVWYEPRIRKTDAVAIVCSGGGYRGSTLEGFELPPLRDYLLEKGMTVVGLCYRGPRPPVGMPRHALAWQDAQRAVRYVRVNAPARGLNPEKIGFAGFSAGGHLTLLAATSSQTSAYPPVDELDSTPCHVNWAVAVYPAYGFGVPAEKPTFEEANDFAMPLAPEFAFDTRTAPLCLVHGGRDAHSAMTSVRVFQKLRTMGIPADLHILAYEDHCFMKAAYPETGAALWKEHVGGWLNVMGLLSVHPNTRSSGWKAHHTAHWRGKVETVADCEKGAWTVSDNNGFRALTDKPLFLRGSFKSGVIDFEYRADAKREGSVFVRGVKIPLPPGRGDKNWRRVTIWFTPTSYVLAVDGELVEKSGMLPQDSDDTRLGFITVGESGLFALRNIFTNISGLLRE